MRHKYAEVIRNWAEGGNIQFRQPPTKEWTNYSCPMELAVPAFNHYEWRIKPPSRHYRVAMFKNENETWVAITTNKEESKAFEKMPSFRSWITDWTEYDV